MLGYIIALCLGLVLAGVFLAGLGRAGPQPDPRKRSASAKPVQAENPAADEPTPDRSVTASAGEISAARRHTPPA